MKYKGFYFLKFIGLTVLLFCLSSCFLFDNQEKKKSENDYSMDESITTIDNKNGITGDESKNSSEISQTNSSGSNQIYELPIIEVEDVEGNSNAITNQPTKTDAPQPEISSKPSEENNSAQEPDITDVLTGENGDIQLPELP